jgi:hypothetical protein
LRSSHNFIQNDDLLSNANSIFETISGETVDIDKLPIDSLSSLSHSSNRLTPQPHYYQVQSIHLAKAVDKSIATTTTTTVFDQSIATKTKTAFDQSIATETAFTNRVRAIATRKTASTNQVEATTAFNAFTNQVEATEAPAPKKTAS